MLKQNQAHCSEPYDLRVQEQSLFFFIITIFASMRLVPLEYSHFGADKDKGCFGALGPLESQRRAWFSSAPLHIIDLISKGSVTRYSLQLLINLLN